MTVEMNCVKFPQADTLYELWTEHKYSLLHFITKVRDTISGFVFDEQTGLGIPNASISIGPKEKIVHTNRYGDYYRLILPGTHEVCLVLCPCV